MNFVWKSCALAAFLVMGVSSQCQASLLTWNTVGNTGTETFEASTSNTGVGPANLTSSGITNTANGNRFGGNDWAIGGTLDTSKYIQFIVNPNSGFKFTATDLTFKWDKSGAGPRSVALRSSIDNFTSNLGSVLGMSGSTSTFKTLNISGVSDITSTTTFRLYGFDATDVRGTGGFDTTTTGTSNNVILNGSISAVPEPSALLYGAMFAASALGFRRRRS